jgi:hypothetical protein
VDVYAGTRKLVELGGESSSGGQISVMSANGVEVFNLQGLAPSSGSVRNGANLMLKNGNYVTAQLSSGTYGGTITLGSGRNGSGGIGEEAVRIWVDSNGYGWVEVKNANGWRTL